MSGQPAPTFLLNARGAPYSNLANIYTAFLTDPALKDRVWYDEFLQAVQTGTPARSWTDADDTWAACYLQTQHGLMGVSSRQVNEVVNRVGRDQVRHCVRDWLHGLAWDGEPRIAEAFCDHWGAEPAATQPHEYLRAVSRNFFVGLVARIMRPGCQLDEMVVFESAQQGIGKTSALRALGGGWYASAHERVTDKDFFQDLQGKWLIEISELAAFSRAQIERIKAVITNPVDHYRASYERRSQDRPRQCVFAGTTNTDDWGTDETGLRRFWPVRCGVIDVPRLQAARPLLFAEAVAAFESDEPWWRVPGSAAEVQADRQAYDEWTPLVMDWVDQESLRQPHVSVNDIAAGALKIDPAKLDKSTQMRIARILKLYKWRRETVRFKNRTRKAWLPPEVVMGGNET